MSEVDQEQQEEMEPVPMGEAVSPEDADSCVIGSVTATMMIHARLGKKWLSLPT
jgi:hypothetical protein